VTLRIAYARLFQETCPFSPVPTTREDFTGFHYYTGQDLARRCEPHRVEVPGFVRNAELSGFLLAARRHNLAAALGRRPRVEPVPLLSAISKPSGMVDRETFDWLRQELDRRLQAAGPLDGVYLALHGSMQVEGEAGSPEVKLLEQVRRRLGPDLPLAVSLDLHAHVTPDLVRQATLLCPYLTNPHRDFFRAGRRSGELLLQAITGRIRPTHAWRKLPVVYGGGLMIDFLPPMRRVFSRLRRLQRSGQVLYASLCMVHPFTMASDIGWVVHVTTDGDRDRAEALADELAEEVWEVSKVPVPRLLEVAEALEQARQAWLARRTGVVSIVDTGDVTSAGAPGGSTWLLSHLVDHPQELSVYVALHDPAALAQLEGRQAGEELELVLRGTPGLPDNPEVRCRGRLLGLYTTDGAGRVATLDLDPVKLIVSEKPPVTIWPRFFRQAGLDPWKADVILQKAFFHYRWFFGLYNRKNIGLRSPGATSLDNLTRVDRSVPLAPLQTVDDWRPHDAVLRGLQDPP
jgi:microcystin degradation protein MlrC